MKQRILRTNYNMLEQTKGNAIKRSKMQKHDTRHDIYAEVNYYAISTLVFSM